MKTHTHTKSGSTRSCQGAPGTGRLRFYANCVNWPADDVHADEGLIAMNHAAEDVTRSTFLMHVDLEDMRELSESLGYARHWSRGLVMSKDWHVSYHRSQLHGRRVYFFRHSAIEYVFTQKGQP